MKRVAGSSELSATYSSEYQEPEDCEFRSTLDGTSQRYVQILPGGFNPTGPNIAMIALHGHGSDRWQYIKDGRGETRGARDVAAKYGMLFISPDYRATTSWMGPKAEADVLQIITDLRKQKGVKKIFMVGVSMGGTSALIFTMRHSEIIDGVCSQNGMANMVEYGGFADAIAASYGGTKAAIPDEYRQRSAELSPQSFTMPVAITVGMKDTIVPPQSVLRLAVALHKANPKVLVIQRDDIGHWTNYDDTVAALEFVINAAADARPKAKRR